MTDRKTPSPRPRDTRRHRDGKLRGIYYRFRVDGSKEWSYYDPRLGRPVGGCQSRQEAIDKRAMAQLAKSAGLPAPDTKTRIADLAEEVREAKRRRLRPSSFRNWQYALDRIILGDFGHLKPTQLGPDRIARLIRDLEERGLSRDTIVKYLQPLSAILVLAVRRGIIASDPMDLLSSDERPHGGNTRKRFEWSPESISGLMAAADELGRRPKARFDYSPLIQVLALTGLRVSEALALKWADVDLLAGVLNVRHSLGREGSLGPPKTKAGARVVPLRPGLVDLLIRLKPLDASDADFVFAGKRGTPLGYWNVRNRGFQKAVEQAGLGGNGLTIHDLRHAAASLYISSGLSAVDVAAVLGHANASTTLRIYAHLFDRSDVEAKVRAAQESVVLPGDDEAPSSM
jgi:integrase